MWKKLLPIISILLLGWIVLNLLNGAATPVPPEDRELTPIPSLDPEFACINGEVNYKLNGAPYWQLVEVRNDYRTYTVNC